MTTITIKEDLPLEKKAFGSVAELFAALEEQNLFVVLHELGEDDVTDDVMEMARQAREDFDKNPLNFVDV